ncbi:hypothetical protein V2W45_1328043 [Cenococcum geophilum]
MRIKPFSTERQVYFSRKYTQIKDRLGDFRIKVNRKFRAIIKEVYGLGFGNNTKKAEKVSKRQFYYKAIVAAYADIFWVNSLIGIAKHRSSAKYFYKLAGATIYFIAEYLPGHYETIKYIGSEEDAMALHRQVAIKFYIFKDAKIRALRYDNEDKQCPNAKLWRNPYNNILDNLFKDLDNKSTESLKAAI